MMVSNVGTERMQPRQIKIAKVLIVEDELLIATLIAKNLNHHAFETQIATSFSEAQQSINNNMPDIVLLDWMLPQGSGTDLLKQLRAQACTRELPVLMITARSAEADKVHGLNSGADDYIVKPFSMQELLARIQAVLRRRSPHISSEQKSYECLRVDTAQQVIFLDNLALKLSAHEFKLLRYFITYPERVHSRAQLVDKVWGIYGEVEERAVDTLIKRIRKTLGAHARLLQTERGFGYRLMKSQQSD